ncbi:LacI family transcriptional regulator [Mycobacterium phage SWU1]|uniref:LacI family transcriptional regulator n=1 Tax=Mycobacterium phage SWU1 TaxID=1175504 RepID=I1V1H5_9CAUD|nr:transcriptional regulator [Mycobacterium phage SWU1]AFI24953.1 LacI family transcriptional regulator [Mycobacterium phage SWU1]
MRYTLSNSEGNLFEKKQVRLSIDTYPEVALKILAAAQKLVDEHKEAQNAVLMDAIKADRRRRIDYFTMR